MDLDEYNRLNSALHRLVGILIPADHQPELYASHAEMAEACGEWAVIHAGAIQTAIDILKGSTR